MNNSAYIDRASPRAKSLFRAASSPHSTMSSEAVAKSKHPQWKDKQAQKSKHPSQQIICAKKAGLPACPQLAPQQPGKRQSSKHQRPNDRASSQFTQPHSRATLHCSSYRQAENASYGVSKPQDPNNNADFGFISNPNNNVNFLVHFQV